jgi:hypothetical protein
LDPTECGEIPGIGGFSYGYRWNYGLEMRKNQEMAMEFELLEEKNGGRT